MFFKRIVSFFYIKAKYRSKVSISYSSMVSHSAHFEGSNKLYPHTSFSGTMGYGSYIGSNSHLTAKIGRFTSIAPEVSSNLGFHPITVPYATTCPMFFSKKRQNGQTFAQQQMLNEIKPPIIIGNDCWIGQRVFITGGIKIDDGAIILAGAVVTKDVPAYAIVGGVPAKIIKYRYDKDTINFLLSFKWWDKSIKWLEENWTLLCDINELKKRYKIH